MPLLYGFYLRSLLGYQAEEIVGQLGDVVFTPEDRRQKAPQQEMATAAQTGRAEDERWHIKKDGSRFWASGTLTALKDEAGNLRGYVKILRDLTARKRAEEAIAADQERFLAQERQAAVLAERNRMAQELHDTLAQGFFAITLQLDAAQDTILDDPDQSHVHLARAQELARASMAQTRRTVRGLRPQELQSQSLSQAFVHLVEQARANTQAAIAFQTEGAPRVLPPDVEVNLFRIGQEALTNAIKYAQATRITLTLTFETGRVRLQVEDNGQGFDPQAASGGGGFGQTSMQERAERIGGQLEVVSRPGEGTRVSLVVRPAPTQTKAWLLAALTSLDDAVIATDTEGKVTYLNPVAEGLTGWTQAEAAGQDVAVVYNAVDEATGEALQRLLVDIARGGEIVKVNADIVLIAKGNKQTPIKDSAAPLQDVGGHTIGVVISFQDDTGPRNARRALEALNARLRESLAETHHRVKNHFQIAAALVDMREGDVEETASATSLKNLKLHIQALAHIHDLLTQEAQAGAEVTFTSGKDTLEKLLPLLRATLTDRVIRFTGEHIRLSVKQSTSLALIVNELVLNAIKYGAAVIEISFQAAEGRAVLEICDAGPGFAEGFDPLVHSRTGLKLVHSLVGQDLDGVLAFENRPEGGARVRVSFPLGVLSSA